MILNTTLAFVKLNKDEKIFIYNLSTTLFCFVFYIQFWYYIDNNCCHYEYHCVKSRDFTQFSVWKVCESLHRDSSNSLEPLGKLCVST